MCVKLVLLPRADMRSKNFLDDLGLSLAKEFGAISFHHYAHWPAAAKKLDTKKELAALTKHLHEEEYVLIGHGEGASVALEGIKQGTLDPKAVVIVDSAGKNSVEDIPLLEMKTAGSGKKDNTLAQHIASFVRNIYK